MKVQYVGTAKEVMIPGIGIVNPNDVIEVSEVIGQNLIQRVDFVEVVEERKEVAEEPAKVPTPEESESSLLSSFTLTKGGENEEWEPDMLDSE